MTLISAKLVDSLFSQATIIVLLAGLIICFALVRGGQPERYCAIIIAGGIAVDRLIYLALGARSFEQFDVSRAIIDGIQMTLLLTVALRANRLYPLGIASAQLLAILGSFSALFISEGWNYAYWAMTQLPLFFQLPILAIGTYAHRRRVAILGDYNEWSPSFSGKAGTT